MTFYANDGAGGTATATFTVTATNSAPTAVDDRASAPGDTPVTIAVLTNDTDPDNDPLQVASAYSPDGTVAINPEGTLTTAAATLLRTASGAPGVVEGTVRISASDVIGVEYLPPILARLRREHPALVVELALTDRVDDLLGRAVDIAVRMTEPTQGALLARRLPPVELGFHAHAGYIARVGKPATLADLSRYDVIGYDAETPALRSMATRLAPLDRRGFALRTDSNLAQLAAIRAGFGIGICQVAVANRDPMLVRILPEITLPLPFWIVMHEDLKTSARYRVVFDALAVGLSRLD